VRPAGCGGGAARRVHRARLHRSALQRRVGLFHVVEAGLGGERVRDVRVGHLRPAVGEVPEEDAPAIRLVAVELHPELRGLALDLLGHADDLVEVLRLRPAALTDVVPVEPVARLPIEADAVGAVREILFVPDGPELVLRHPRLDDLAVGEAQVADLGHHARLLLHVEVGLVRETVAPDVAVALHRGVLVVGQRGVRRGRDVGRERRVGLHDIAEHLLAQAVVAVGRIVEAIVGEDVVLVVAEPGHDAGVVPQAPHLELGLAPRLVEEGGILRVAAAGEHEVVGDDDAEFVAAGVEVILLVDAAAPDAHGVDVGVLGGLEQQVVAGGVHAGEDRVGRRPVHALEEDLLPVDRDDERDAAVVVRLLDEIHGADAELAAAPVELAAAAAEDRCPFVQGLRAVIVRPPELRLGHDEALDVARARRIAGEGKLAGLTRDGELDLDRSGRAVVVAQLDEGLQFGAAVRAQRDRADKHVGDLDLVDEEPRHGLPDADGDEARRDVPAVAGLGLAHLQAEGVAVAAHLGAAGGAVRRIDGGTETDLETVGAGLHVVGDVHAQRREHVLVLPDDLAVELHGGEAVQPLEQQVQPLAGPGRGRREVGAVPPVPLLHPTDLIVVHPHEGIADQAGALAVEVDVTGHLRVDPALVERQGRAAGRQPKVGLGRHEFPRGIQGQGLFHG